MAKTLLDIVIPRDDWVDVSALSDFDKGENSFLQNKGSTYLFVQYSDTKPDADDNSGFTMDPAPSRTVNTRMSAEGLSVWMKASGRFDGRAAVRNVSETAIPRKVRPKSTAARDLIGGPAKRLVPEFNGIDQYLTFAQAIVGQGQGELVMELKLADAGDVVSFLVDSAVDGLSRPYTYKDTVDDHYTTVGALAVTVDEGVAIAYGKLARVTVTGDFTGLAIGTLLARYNGVSCANTQLFSFSYTDDNHKKEHGTDLYCDFQSLKGFEVFGSYGRNLVTQNATTTWDGTEADWSTKVLGPDTEVGKTYLITETVSAGSTGSIKVETGTEDGAWTSFLDTSLGETSRSYIRTPSGSNRLLAQTNQGDYRFIGTVTIKVHEVSNALIYNGNVQHQQYVQQPNGDWLLKGSAPAEYIVLSDYQRNQHYIEQAEKAIAGYKAKDNSPVLSKGNGADIRVTGLYVTLSGAFDIEWDWLPDPSTNNKAMSSTAGGHSAFSWDSNGNLVAMLGGSWEGLGHHTMSGGSHHMRLGRDENNNVSVWVDHSPVAGSFNFEGDFIINQLLVWGNQYLDGRQWYFSIIDHTAPLPLGQGGNSMFLPMNAAGDTVPNVLGLDAKGNVVAKDGKGVAGHSTWNGSPVQSQFTRDKVGGSLVHTKPMLINDVTGSGWVSSVYTLHNGAGNTVSIRPGQTDIVPKLGEFLETPYGDFECVIDVSTFQFSVPDELDAQVTAWLIAEVVAGNTVNILQKLPLSPELQRLHDLNNRVLPVVAKFDKGFSKTMPLWIGNGADQFVKTPTWAPTGSFEIRGKALLEGDGVSGWQVVVGSETTQKVAVGFRENDTVRATKQSAVDAPLPALPSAQNKLVGIGYLFELVGGVYHITYTLGDDKAGPFNTGFTPADIDFDQIARFASGLHYEGGIGPMLYLDYANPLNSRYMKPEPYGWVDLLATVGDELWQWNGLVTGGNQWGNLHVGGQLVHNSTAGVVGMVLITAKLLDAPVGAAVQFRVGSAQLAVTDTDPELTVLVDADTASLSAVEASASGTAIGATLEVSIKEYPNAGINQGDPVDPIQVTKSEDDWYGPELDVELARYGVEEDAIHTFIGNRASTERITASGYTGHYITLPAVGDYLVEVEFHEVVGGAWKINDGATGYVTELASSQIVTTDANKRLLIEDRNPVIGEKLDVTYTIKQVIKGA